jgi:DHA2 family multidrug resistance protein
MLVMMPIAGRLYNRAGPRLMVGVGLAVIAFGYWELTRLTIETGYWDLVWPQVWQGVGFSLLFAALSTAALAAVPRERMTAATGLYNVVRQVMGSIGIALAATMLTHGQATYHALLAEDASGAQGYQWLAATAAAMRRLGADVVSARDRALAILDLRVEQQSTVLAYNHIFALVALLFAIVVPLVLLLPRTAHVDGEVELVME